MMMVMAIIKMATMSLITPMNTTRATMTTMADMLINIQINITVIIKVPMDIMTNRRQR